MAGGAWYLWCACMTFVNNGKRNQMPIYCDYTLSLIATVNCLSNAILGSGELGVAVVCGLGLDRTKLSRRAF